MIIPVFNGESTILETIASVRAQTFEDFEIVVINDGSTDRTLHIVESVGDPRIRVLSYANGGLACARNRGLDRARGEFISFVDADDLWMPDKLSSQIGALKQDPRAGAAYSWTAFIDERGRFLYAKERVTFEGNVYEHLLLSNFIASGSNVLLRRSCVDVVGRFDESVVGGVDDWKYWLRVARDWRVVLVPKYQVLYRFSRSSMTSHVERMEAGLLDVIEREFAAAPAELRYLKRASIAWTKQYLAFVYAVRTSADDSLGKAWLKLRESIRGYPRIFLARKTQFLIWSLLLMSAVPRAFRARLFRAIMRLYGRITRVFQGQLDIARRQEPR